MDQNNLQNNQNDPTFNLQSTAEQHNNNYVIADSFDNIPTFYTNHYSHQQPTYNENITSTLPPGSSPCVPGPQQTIEHTTFPLSPFMNSVIQSGILSIDITGYKIIVSPIPPNPFSNNHQSRIRSLDIPGYKIIVTPFPLKPFSNNYQSGILSFDTPGHKIIVTPFPLNPFQPGIFSFDTPGYKVIFMPTPSQQENTYLNNTQFTQFQQ
ncbi:hypothetical protein C1646_808789 [Rhizophagus diaphanus]|nr:hypothetical protein C1646_808789 [Rhizophagus diaphanus] [Rhizophagus sp. MUCL 43196]